MITPTLSPPPRHRLLSRLAIAAGMASGLACAAWAHADGPKLPASAIGRDTFLVARIDPAKTDPAAVDTALKAFLGDAAAASGRDIAPAKEVYKGLTDAGAQSLTVVASADPTGAGKAASVAYARFQPGTDHAAADAKLKAARAKAAAGVVGAGGLVTAWDGDVLVLREKGVAPPRAADADRARRFDEASAPASNAADLVFIPTESQRAWMKMQAGVKGVPTWAGAILTDAAEARSAWVGVTLGSSPKLDVTFTAVDEIKAQQFAGATAEGAKQLKAQVAEARRIGDADATALADLIEPIVRSLDAKQAGARVTLTIDTVALAALGKLLLPTFPPQPPPQPPSPEDQLIGPLRDIDSPGKSVAPPRNQDLEDLSK